MAGASSLRVHGYATPLHDPEDDRLSAEPAVGRIAHGRSKLALEGAVEDGGEQGVEFGGGFGLEVLEGVHLFL